MNRQTQVEARRPWTFSVALAAALCVSGWAAAAPAPVGAASASAAVNTTTTPISQSTSLTSLPLSPPYDVRNPPQGIFDDEWMQIFVLGRKAGYGHTFFRREGDKILTESHEVFQIGREGSAVTVSQDVTTEETVDGQPRVFHAVNVMASEPSIADGHGDGKTFSVTLQSGAYKNTMDVTLPEGSVMAWGQQRLTQLKGFAPGTHYQMLAYSPEDDPFKPMPTDVTVDGKEKIRVRGLDIDATKVEARMGAKDGVGGITATTWEDPEGRDIRVLMPMGTMTMEMTPATKEEALTSYVPADIFETSLLTLDRPIPADATTVVLRLRRRDGQALPAVPESANEHGETLSDGSVRLTLKRLDVALLAQSTAAAAPAALKDPAPYLARNEFLDTSDPLLHTLAQRAGGLGNTPPSARAARMRDFVTRYINKKDYDVGFATASEVAKSREGDCTEHAVLLAALGRISGIPTRVAVGLAYVPEYEGHKNVLGFHMWSQFYLNGEWVDCDAALNDRSQTYWRLGLSVNDLDDASAADMSLDLMSWMGDLDVTLESASPAAGN